MEETEQYAVKSEVLKSLGHPVRLSIAALLLRVGNANVTNIHTALNLPQSTVSLHLNRLKSSKVVKGTRYGLEIHYEIPDPQVRKMLEVFL